MTLVLEHPTKRSVTIYKIQKEKKLKAKADLESSLIDSSSVTVFQAIYSSIGGRPQLDLGVTIDLQQFLILCFHF